MGRALLSLLVLLSFSAAFAKEIRNVYCIQVLTGKSLKSMEKDFERLSDFEYTRIEKIGNFLVLRVGNERSVKPLKPVLRKIKKYRKYKDAFIRVCDILPERIIKANFTFEEKEEKPEPEKTEFAKKDVPSNVKKEKKFQKKKLKDIFKLISKKENEFVSTKKVKHPPKKEKINKKVEIEPYAKLSLELLEVDKEGIKQILDRYEKLPYRDEVLAYRETNQISKAYKKVYNNLTLSYFDYLAYKQAVDLYMDFSNFLYADTAYEHIQDVSRVNLDLGFKNYLFDGIYATLQNKTYINTYYDRQTYKNLMSIDTSIAVKLEKLYEDGNSSITFGVRKSFEVFPFFEARYGFNVNKYFFSAFSLSINSYANESNYAFYSSVKDQIKYEYVFNFNNKNTVEGYISLDRYLSQDRKPFATGYTLYSNYVHKYRLAYPDFSTYSYLLIGNYNEDRLKEGNSFDKMLIVKDAQILPDSFIETGAGFFFGIDNIYVYRKQLRPFLDVNLSYNNVYGIGYLIYLGMAGEMFDNDNLSFGFSIDRGFYGNPYMVYRINTYYRKWF